MRSAQHQPVTPPVADPRRWPAPLAVRRAAAARSALFRSVPAVWDEDGFLVAGEAAAGVVVAEAAPAPAQAGWLWYQPSTNNLYVFDGSNWVAPGGVTTGVGEAPLTGGPYVRQAGAWVEIFMNSGTY